MSKNKHRNTTSRRSHSYDILNKSLCHNRAYITVRFKLPSLPDLDYVSLQKVSPGKGDCLGVRWRFEEL